LGLDISLPDIFSFLEKPSADDRLRQEIITLINDKDASTLKLILRVIKAIVEK